MLKQLAVGLASFVPGTVRLLSPRAREPRSARYCYSVWLRHLVLAADRTGPGVPRVVAELGPGDSLGVGLAALFSGADLYFAFDLVRHASPERNLAVFDELVELFRRREQIPGAAELPEVGPALDDYRFPASILTDSRLRGSLAAGRIARIRASILRPEASDSCIRYQAPWHDTAVILPGTVDLVLSQAVLEHIDDLTVAYRALFRWLRPGGLMSHKIDYRCHGLDHHRWNAHWTYSGLTWRLLRGRRPYFLNRLPHSAHLQHLESSGFEVLLDRRTAGHDGAPRRELAQKFQELSDEDLRVSGAFILARRPG